MTPLNLGHLAFLKELLYSSKSAKPHQFLHIQWLFSADSLWNNNGGRRRGKIVLLFLLTIYFMQILFLICPPPQKKKSFRIQYSTCKKFGIEQIPKVYITQQEICIIIALCVWVCDDWWRATAFCSKSIVDFAPNLRNMRRRTFQHSDVFIFNLFICFYLSPFHLFSFLIPGIRFSLH